MGGSREGAADVSIWSAAYHPRTSTWFPPKVVVARESVEKATGLHLRKLGNPVAARRPDGTVELYFVAVSLGGWSGSAIYRARSADGRHFHDPERLITSPCLNVSTLVKAPPVELVGGGLAIPAYHEAIQKYPQWLEFDPGGRLVRRRNLQSGRDFIQPWWVPGTGPAGRGSVFLRRWYEVEPPEVHRADTTDGGRTWSAPVPVGVPNPNASVAAVRLADDRLVMAYNHSDEHRRDLSLAVSADDGTTWSKVLEVDGPSREPDEKELPRIEYSYPWLMLDSSGQLHLFYTWNRREIRHLRIGADVLEPQSGETP